jgi:hypothetical protein
MTRHGSLAYYLAAWICGCFFMSALVWLKDLASAPLQLATLKGAAGLLFFCFYGLILGAFASLVGAFLLRRIATSARWMQAWQWALAGAVLAPVVIGLLGAWWNRVWELAGKARPWLSILAFGPSLILDAGLWLAIPAGDATALVLYRIHRAFAPSESTQRF